MWQHYLMSCSFNFWVIFSTYSMTFTIILTAPISNVSSYDTFKVFGIGWIIYSYKLKFYTSFPHLQTIWYSWCNNSLTFQKYIPLPKESFITLVCNHSSYLQCLQYVIFWSHIWLNYKMNSIHHLQTKLKCLKALYNCWSFWELEDLHTRHFIHTNYVDSLVSPLLTSLYFNISDHALARLFYRYNATLDLQEIKLIYFG
jgi:hypothetical protein